MVLCRNSSSEPASAPPSSHPYPCAGRNRVALSQFDARAPFDAQPVPQESLLGMIGTGGVARSGTNATIALVDHILRGELLALAVAPGVTRALVHEFRECLRQAIGERLGHDRIIVVVVALK